MSVFYKKQFTKTYYFAKQIINKTMNTLLDSKYKVVSEITHTKEKFKETETIEKNSISISAENNSIGTRHTSIKNNNNKYLIKNEIPGW